DVRIAGGTAASTGSRASGCRCRGVERIRSPGGEVRRVVVGVGAPAAGAGDRRRRARGRRGTASLVVGRTAVAGEVLDRAAARAASGGSTARERSRVVDERDLAS